MTGQQGCDLECTVQRMHSAVSWSMGSGLPDAVKQHDGHSFMLPAVQYGHVPLVG
jgi:hypothetical protein